MIDKEEVNDLMESSGDRAAPQNLMSARKRVVKREILEDYSSSVQLKALAEKELLSARNTVEDIKQQAFQSGFEQGIRDANIEVSSVVLGLKEDFNRELDDLVETMPDMIAEICIRLTRMQDKKSPAYQLFSKQLQSLVIESLKDYSSQTQLVLRASSESVEEVTIAIINHFGSDWVDANLQIREEPSSQGFEFSIEHSRGVLSFDGRHQLVELLNKAFPEDDVLENDVLEDDVLEEALNADKLERFEELENLAQEQKYDEINQEYED